MRRRRLRDINPIRSVSFRVRRWFQYLRAGWMPLDRMFDRVYATGAWGVEDGSRLYSGSGARGWLKDAYCTMMKPELQRRGVRSLVDLGCGDFHVGAELAQCVTHYIGIDVSRLVIAENRRRYATEHRQFLHVDATRDPLPPGDAVVIRQVLQHLTNAEIAAILRKVVAQYPLIFITEHIHEESGDRPNLDMLHGPETRLRRRSGVRIDLPPYSLRASVLGEVSAEPETVIRTWVVEGERRA